jgi:tRNA(Arg) A34 adenosine deaminase TadA
VNPDDIRQLRRCIELAAVAVDRGDDPFGSVMVTADGSVVAERSNRVITDSDVTAHPELLLASWAGGNLTAAERAGATMYTSGEHCPMCATALVWAGIGRLVFVLSQKMIGDLAPPEATVFDLPARDVVAASNATVTVEGPCPELVAEAAALFGR